MRKQLSFWLSIITIGLITSCGGDDAAPTPTPEPTPTISAPVVEGLFQPGGGIIISFTTTGTFKEGNIFKAQLSDANGSFTNPVELGTLAATTPSNIEATLPASVNNGTQYRIRIVSTEPAIISPDNGANLSIAAPSISISSINTAPTAGLTYIAGRIVRLTFTKTGVFASNNQFTIQMSDASGSFTNPTQLASVNNSLGNTYDITIPTTTTAGSYKFRVVSTSPAITGAASESISVVNVSLSAPSVSGTLSAGGTINISTNITNGPVLGTISFQLSNASGSFSSPISVGSFISVVNPSLNISYTLPANLPPGNGYRIRVISTQPNVQADSNPISVSALPTLTLTEAAPSFTRMYSASANTVGYFMYYNFTVQGTGVWNPSTVFTIEYTRNDVNFQNTDLTGSGLVAATIINGTSVNVLVGIRNLTAGPIKFRIRAIGHDVVSNLRSFQVFSTALNSLSMTIAGTNYNFTDNRTVASNTSSGSNNRSIFLTGEAVSSIVGVAKLRGFVQFSLSNEVLNIGSGNINIIANLFLLNSNGTISDQYNSTSISATISGNATGYTATFGSSTFTKFTSGSGPATLALSGGAFNFKLE
ncbi:MAG: hypothetical protein ACK57K_15150 [Chryseotalea sp.]|jgi:hypothetical protein|nr:hypothetical protein [Flammeovirgaceae bacterium]